LKTLEKSVCSVLEKLLFYFASRFCEEISKLRNFPVFSNIRLCWYSHVYCGTDQY